METAEFDAADLSVLRSRVEVLENASASNLAAHTNFIWLFVMVCAFNILLMQAGFAFLEVGRVQAKNAKSILFKNVLDMALAAVVWWLMGFRIAGDGVLTQNKVGFIQSYAFAGTAATLVSGAVAERINPTAYIYWTMAMVGVIYPLAVRWTWSTGGFLRAQGFVDCAGGGVVHLTGGCAGLVGTMMLGPRTGRFQALRPADGKEEGGGWGAAGPPPPPRSVALGRGWARRRRGGSGPVTAAVLKPHSVVLSTLGTLLLLFGWLSFNTSSILGSKPTGDEMNFELASLAAANTLLSAATSTLTYVLWKKVCSFCVMSRWSRLKSLAHEWLAASVFAGPHLDIQGLNNALLSGAVAITAGCARVDGWAALLIGGVAAIVGMLASEAVVSLGVDDPLDVAAVHGAAGLWGVLSVGLFATADTASGDPYGLLYGGGGALLWSQFRGGLILLTWSMGTSLCVMLFFRVCPTLVGFRIGRDEEVAGMDFVWYNHPGSTELDRQAVRLYNEIRSAERRLRARRNKNRRGHRHLQNQQPSSRTVLENQNGSNGPGSRGGTTIITSECYGLPTRNESYSYTMHETLHSTSGLSNGVGAQPSPSGFSPTEHGSSSAHQGSGFSPTEHGSSFAHQGLLPKHFSRMKPYRLHRKQKAIVQQDTDNCPSPLSGSAFDGIMDNGQQQSSRRKMEEEEIANTSADGNASMNSSSTTIRKNSGAAPGAATEDMPPDKNSSSPIAMRHKGIRDPNPLLHHVDPIFGCTDWPQLQQQGKTIVALNSSGKTLTPTTDNSSHIAWNSNRGSSSEEGSRKLG